MEASLGGDGPAREGSPRKTSSSSSSTSPERCWWRWINAARCVVALALTVLIVVVIVYAFKVEFRDKQLIVTVTNGFVAVAPPARSGEVLVFKVTVEAFNPSGHGQVLFTDVIVFLAAKNRSDMPMIFTVFNLGNMTVLPQLSMVSDASVSAGIGVAGEDSTLKNPAFRYYYDEFSNGTIIRDAALRLSGTIQTEAYFGYKTDVRAVVYCCSPITVGYENDAGSTNNKLCTEQKASMEQQPDATLLSCELPP